MSRKELIDEFLDSLDDYMEKFTESKNCEDDEYFSYENDKELREAKKELAKSLEKLLNYSKKD